MAVSLFINLLGFKKIRKKYFVFTHGMLDPWFQRKYPKAFKKEDLLEFV